MERLIDRMLAPIKRRITNMITRVTITAVNSALKTQRVQIGALAGEGKTDIEQFEAYGFTSSPLAGAEGVGLFFCGDRSHGVVICVGDKRFRLTEAKPGEVAMYDDQGQVVHLTRDGIKIESHLDVELRGRNVRIHGNERLIIECNGHGEEWLPDRKNTYTQGAAPGTSNPIHPPEIP
ncbi:phage baseplate assembly protein V [Methylobacillus pratensis]